MYRKVCLDCHCSSCTLGKKAKVAMSCMLTKSAPKGFERMLQMGKYVLHSGWILYCLLPRVSAFGTSDSSVGIYLISRVFAPLHTNKHNLTSFLLWITKNAFKQNTGSTEWLGDNYIIVTNWPWLLFHPWCKGLTQGTEQHRRHHLRVTSTDTIRQPLEA